MSEPAEDTTPDEQIGLSVVEKPKSEFTRPPYQFKGVKLWPYKYGDELLFNQVRDAEDTGLFTWMGFIFLLLKRSQDETWEEHRDWGSEACWKVKEFRKSLMQWMDAAGPFSIEDKIEAKRIYEENMKAIAEATVEPVPVRGKAQKKTSHQRTPQLSISSETNLDVAATKSSGG